jgi:hypothetical protein
MFVLFAFRDNNKLITGYCNTLDVFLINSHKTLIGITMKQGLLILTIALLLIMKLDAQKLSVGALADANFSSIKGSGFSNTLKPGFNAGAFGLFKISKTFSVEPQVMFSQHVVRTSSFTYYYDPSQVENIDVVLNNINGGVLLDYSLNKTITLKAGPQYSYLFFVNKYLLESNAESFKKNDVGIVGDVSLNVTPRVQLNFKYYRGFSNLDNILTYRNWYKRQISVGLSYVVFKKLT